MTAAILVLCLLFCVAVSAIAVRVLRVPLPLTQIALGAAVGAPSFGLHVDLDPHLFLLLFVPPLLFADGWRMPKRELFAMRNRILSLAFGLVLVTVVAVGYLLHWMIPQMPLAAAFALAAVLSPTDAVAVAATAGRSGIPRQMMYVLQGEALMNDATGLTAFKFAIAAAMTGAFSLANASGAFALVSVGGLLIGAVMGWALAVFQHRLAGWTSIQSQGTIVMNLLLPFAAYLLAEEAGTSGILAAVAAGVTLNLKSSLDPGAETRIASTHVWQMIEYTLNGLIFVLLGLQLPDIIGKTVGDAWHAGGLPDAAHLIGYAAITTLAMILIRLTWVWTVVAATRLLARLRGRSSRLPTVIPSRLAWAASLAGVRGAITLAGVLSVPLLLADGSPFPLRDLMIFIATGVILLSLLTAAVGLPLLLRGVQVDDDTEEREERAARIGAAEAAIAAVALASRNVSGSEVMEGDESAPTSAAASRMIETYQQRLRALREDGDGPADERESIAADRALRLAGIRAERVELIRLHHADEINDVVFHELLYELDVRESTLVPRTREH